MTLAGPQGRFVLDATSGRPLVFAACDLGFAPVKSLVEYALSAEAAASCTILWLATRPDGHYLANQCRAWADSLDGFHFVALTGDDPAAGAARLLDAWPGISGAAACDVYVAGSEAFNRACASAFRQAGVPEARLFSEVV